MASKCRCALSPATRLPADDAGRPRPARGASGLIGYSLLAELASKRFWALPAWRDRQRRDGFERELPHLEGMRGPRPHVLPTTFVTWTARGRDLPIACRDAKAGIAAADAAAGALGQAPQAARTCAGRIDNRIEVAGSYGVD